MHKIYKTIVLIFNLAPIFTLQSRNLITLQNLSIFLDLHYSVLTLFKF